MPSGRQIFIFFALRMITGPKIPGTVIPRRVFTQPGSFASLGDWLRQPGVAGPRRRDNPYTESFFQLGSAETFLATDPSLGTIAAGSQFQSIEIEYFLDYNSGTSAVIPNGFGLAYELAPKRFTLMTATAAWDFAAAPLRHTRAVDLGDDAHRFRWPRMRRISRLAQGRRG